MRFIPRGKPLYENLPTVFLNWEEMAAKLRGDKFSGYIIVNSDTKSGVILFVEGRISGSLFNNLNLPAARGQEALSKTTTTIQERKGILSIYATSTDICSLVDWYIEGSTAYSPMESFFIDYEKFLTVLGEKSFTGLVSVTNDDFAHFIYVADGKVKGHFTDGSPELQDNPGILKDKLVSKGTKLEVFTRTDGSKQVRFDQGPAITPPIAKAENFTPVIEPPPPVKPIFTPPPTPPVTTEPVKPSFEPTKPAFEPAKPEVKIEPPKTVEPIKPVNPIRASGRPVINIPEDEVPDPFAVKKPATPPAEEPKAPTPPKEEPPKFTPPPVAKVEPPTPPPPSNIGGQTVVTPPSGKVAFLIDGIRKVAQSNIGEDMLPWLDGQITRMKTINPSLSKRDLLLLVDEIERYVRTVRQNPTKATKLSSQLRHIIESFASDLE